MAPQGGRKQSGSELLLLLLSAVVDVGFVPELSVEAMMMMMIIDG